MKTCASRRESVALLACGACSVDEAADLRQHLRSCAGCREYFESLSAVCEEQTNAAEQLPEVRVPLRLFARVASRIRAGSPPRQPETRPAVSLGWPRIAGLATLLTLLVGSAIWFYTPLEPSPAPNVSRLPRPPRVARAESAPTTGNSLVAYRRALDRSPEALEQLLAVEAARPTSSPRIVLRVGPDPGEFEL